MPLSEKALRAWLEFWNKRMGVPPPSSLPRIGDGDRGALSAFQAALLEELREKVNGAPCASGSHPVAESSCLLRRDAVLALLSPPPPEPRFKAGDMVVYENEDVAVVYADDGGEFVFTARIGVNRPQNGIGMPRKSVRPATDEEVRRARGEERL